MAAPNLAFPLRFLVSGTSSPRAEWRVIVFPTERTVSEHSELTAALDEAEALNSRRGYLALPQCEFELPGFGPCDAEPCGRRAIASSLALQIPVCASCLARIGDAEVL
ncbi:MAG TPA: hypothetical protein VKP61_00650 [Candidatus Acidoferrum sp.]|nr:hypothetical protein [Candidatus Acidoferrum sp.]